MEVKVGDHIIPRVTRFKYFESIVQNDTETQVNELNSNMVYDKIS